MARSHPGLLFRPLLVSIPKQLQQGEMKIALFGCNAVTQFFVYLLERESPVGSLRDSGDRRNSGREFRVVFTLEVSYGSL